MNGLERWAVFFRYTPDKEKRELMNEIIMFAEGIAMAGQVLLTINKDEKERARLTNEYKFAVDLQSKTDDAKREGCNEERIIIARNMLKRNRPIIEIVEDIGLIRDVVEGLRDI